MTDAPKTVVITATVIAVIPEYHQTVCETQNGVRYTVARKTAGKRWDMLVEGESVELEVYTNKPIVKEVIWFH